MLYDVFDVAPDETGAPENLGPVWGETAEGAAKTAIAFVKKGAVGVRQWGTDRIITYTAEELGAKTLAS